MKGIVTMNSDYAEDVANGFQKYFSSTGLMTRFTERGHDLGVVFPEDISVEGRDVTFRRAFRYGPHATLTPEDPKRYASGDFVMVRRIGDNASNPSAVVQKLMVGLGRLEERFGFVFNGAEALRYHLKENHRELDLPFIPSYKVESVDDLLSLVESGEHVVAKPTWGFKGNGIKYLSTRLDVLDAFDVGSSFGDYVFETYSPAEFEERYAFLDGEVIVARKKFPGRSPKSAAEGRSLALDQDPQKVEMVLRAAKASGMFFGSVDFYGNYVLEVNGSGLGTTTGRDPLCWDIRDKVIDAIERRV
jgi:glutathione synthase/RimK-type ligase-like ATP-grasp enzyme